MENTPILNKFIKALSANFGLNAVCSGGFVQCGYEDAINYKGLTYMETDNDELIILDTKSCKISDNGLTINCGIELYDDTDELENITSMVNSDFGTNLINNIKTAFENVCKSYYISIETPITVNFVIFNQYHKVQHNISSKSFELKVINDPELVDINYLPTYEIDGYLINKYDGYNKSVAFKSKDLSKGNSILCFSGKTSTKIYATKDTEFSTPFSIGAKKYKVTCYKMFVPAFNTYVYIDESLKDQITMVPKRFFI